MLLIRHKTINARVDDQSLNKNEDDEKRGKTKIYTICTGRFVDVVVVVDVCLSRIYSFVL